MINQHLKGKILIQVGKKERIEGKTVVGFEKVSLSIISIDRFGFL